jgi:intracellular sulfur oxidation DsrE/DsrF family protein
MSGKDISEERLNAFIDDELDASEKGEVFEALSRNTGLSQQACELRQLSELVRHAYGNPPEIEAYRTPKSRPINRWGRAVAATLLLGLGATLGWISHQPTNTQTAPSISAMYWDEHNAFQNTDLAKVTEQQGTKKIIVHLNTSSVNKFEKALGTAEQLLETYANSDKGAEIEVVANASAIKMLRAGYSPYSQRVRELQQRYINLTFLACKDAIDHIHELEGPQSQVQLLPDVDVTPSALEHILNRLSEGWVYLNV